MWDISKHEEKLESTKPVPDEIIDSSEGEPGAAAAVVIEVILGLMVGCHVQGFPSSEHWQHRTPAESWAASKAVWPAGQGSRFILLLW